MGFWNAASSIGSAAIGGGLGLAGASSANATNKELQRRAHRWQEREADKARHFTRRQAKRTRKYNAFQAKKARNWSGQQARKSRQFERHMSNTAMFRRVRDMKRAGINPIYGAMSQGASTPNAPVPGASSAAAMAPSAPSAGSAGMMPAINELGTAVSTAVQSGRLAQELSLGAENKKILRAEGKKRRFEAEAAKYNAHSAKSLSKIKEDEAKGVESYGTHSTGQFFRSLEQMFMRAWKGARGLLESDDPTVIDIYPGPGPLLPDERYGPLPLKP